MGFSKLGALALFALVSGIGQAACSGKASQSANGAGGAGAAGNAPSAGEANAAGRTNSDEEAGASGAAPRNPNLPAPPDDSCERFQISEAACHDRQCPPWPCDLSPSPSELWCMPFQPQSHCIGSFACPAADDTTANQDLLACLALYWPCKVDADCDEGYCVVDAHHASGSCESGVAGARCRADEDCRAGNLCIAVQADGKRACSDGAEGSLCNLDTECKAKRCFHPPGSTIVGMCSDGKPGAPCFPPAHDCPPGAPCPTMFDGGCEGDLACIPVATQSTPGGALCSSGNLGEPCHADSDCKSQHCPTAVDSVCSAGAEGDPCKEALDCEAGFCGPKSKISDDGSLCTSGETGASCLKGADCKSGHCDLTAEGAPFWSVCADRLGKTGEACQINDDCQNQVCGQNSIGKVCTNGQVGDACGEAAECASGFCAPAPMIFFQCSNGALGDRCFKDADCTSQHCALDASQGYAVCGP